jgi:hypothetical protein
MTSGEIVGLITGILTIIGVIVATTRYVTQLQFKVRQERLEAEKEGLEKRFGDIEARYKELLNEIEISRRVGTASLTRKKDIDDTLLSIMKAMFAEAGAILRPFRARVSVHPANGKKSNVAEEKDNSYAKQRWALLQDWQAIHKS